MPRVSKKAEATPSKVVAWRPEAWRTSFNPPISKSQMQEWLNDGTLPSSQPGGYMRFILVSPAEFMAQHRVAVAQTGSDA
jgi:hypothetical protein